MLILQPSSVIYFCTRDPVDPDYGIQRATIKLEDDSPRTGQYAKFSVRDSKCDHGESRVVNLQEHTAATVYIYGFEDKDHVANVTWLSDGTVGIECDINYIKVLRQKIMIGCGFKPEWEHVG